MSGTLEAAIVAVRWHNPTRAHYLEAYENEQSFWDDALEIGVPERAYKLQDDKLVDWNIRDAWLELRRDEAMDRRHQEARRIA